MNICYNFGVKRLSSNYFVLSNQVPHSYLEIYMPEISQEEMIISTIHIKISSCVINRHTHRHIHHLNACRHASFLDTRNLCLYKFNILLLSLPVMEIRHPNRSNLEEKSFFWLPVLVYGPLLLGSHSSTHLKELFTLHPLPRAESNGSIMHTD